MFTKAGKRRLAVTTAILATAVGCASAVQAEASPKHTASALVRTDNGPVRGTTTGTVRTSQGIPYAAPPTKGLRWKAPQPATTHSGTRSAGDHTGDLVPSTDPTGRGRRA